MSGNDIKKGRYINISKMHKKKKVKKINSVDDDKKPDGFFGSGPGQRYLGQRERIIAQSTKENKHFLFQEIDRTVNNKGYRTSYCLNSVDDFKITCDNKHEFYEIIKLKGYKDKGVPPYFDIEYYESQPDEEPFNDIMFLLNKYINSKYKFCFGDIN